MALLFIRIILETFRFDRIRHATLLYECTGVIENYQYSEIISSIYMIYTKYLSHVFSP